jgi:hypothetical protein
MTSGLNAVDELATRHALKRHAGESDNDLQRRINAKATGLQGMAEFLKAYEGPRPAMGSEAEIIANAIIEWKFMRDALRRQLAFFSPGGAGISPAMPLDSIHRMIAELDCLIADPTGKTLPPVY